MPPRAARFRRGGFLFSQTAVCLLVLHGLWAAVPAAPDAMTGAPVFCHAAALASAGSAFQEENFCRRTAADFLAAHDLAGASEMETARRIYDYLIENVSFAPPVGLDVWRYRGGQTIPPTYVENRSLSPLLFSTGSCEDFSAAMTLLLHAAGIPARYVAGYTLSVNGLYTDHAWVVARIGGGWYHFDPQLEQNLTRGFLSYRYFMKSDAVMARDHLWGESLLDYAGHKATPVEALRIRLLYTPPPCETSGPPLEARRIQLPRRPDLDALRRQLDAEREARPLPERRLNTDPPVLVASQPLANSDPK